MKYPTVFCILCTLFFMSISHYTTSDSISADKIILTPTEVELREELVSTLLADQLIRQGEAVKVEFEFHDLFVNERILDYDLMAKYQNLLRSYGIQSGPQRQVRIGTDGSMIIGDFDDWGQLITAPIRLGNAVALSN